MMKIRISVFVAALGLIPISALADDDRAYGAGHVNYEKVYGDVKGHRIFTLNVRRDELGEVNGHAYDQDKVKDPSPGGFEESIKNHIRVDCLFILGNTAFMSGTIEKTNEEDPSVRGARVTFSVVDNDPVRGPRRKNPADMVSFTWIGPIGNPLTCFAEDPRHRLRDPITSGDIKVRPAGLD